MNLSMGAGDDQYAGRTASKYHSMAGSPRYASGCVSTFLHLIFDLNPAKRRFSSTKRLAEGKRPEVKTTTLRRSRSARSDRGRSETKVLRPHMSQVCDQYAQAATEVGVDVDEVVGGVNHRGGDASADDRARTGVVARLMGLESLPESVASPHELSSQPYRCQSCGGGGRVLRLASHLADRSGHVSDGSTTPVPVHRLQNHLRIRSGRRTLRDRMPGFANQEAMISAMDVDTPDHVHRRAGRRGNYPKPQALAPSSPPQCTVTLLRPDSKLHGAPRGSPAVVRVPVLSSTTTLQQSAPGWPLAGQRVRDLDYESCSDDAISLRSSAESDSLSTSERANSFRRRGNSSTWSASEGSDSENEQEISSSRGDDPLRPVQLFTHREWAVPSSWKPSPKLTRTILEADAMALKIMSKLDGYRALKVRSRSQDVSGSRVFPSAGTSPSRGAGRGRRYGSLAQEEGLDIEREMKFWEQESLSYIVRQNSCEANGREKVCEAPVDLAALMGYRSKTLEDTATQNSRRIISNHALRARPSIGFDHSEKLPFASSVCTDKDMGLTICADDASQLSRPSHHLRWVDEEIAERRADDSSQCGRCCEETCESGRRSMVSSGSDVDDTSDVDDESRSGDAWSSCASYNAADSDSPRTFEIPDTDADSDLELEKPGCVKMVCDEDLSDHGATAGVEQPSPVSILNSPFHDEPCTTSDSSTLADSHRQRQLDEDIGIESCNNDKIRQALLDISMFQSLEVVTTFDHYKERNYAPRIGGTSGAKYEDQQISYVQEILSAAKALSSTAPESSSSPTWFSHDSAIDPSLFDRLELCGDDDNMGSRRGGMWRCDRKLLFDCVNEALNALILPSRYRLVDGVDIGMLEQQQCTHQLKGQIKLVEDVHKKIEEWRKHGDESVTSKRDDYILCSSWKDFSAEVAEVGLAIENMIWRAIVEEAVADILSSS